MTTFNSAFSKNVGTSATTVRTTTTGYTDTIIGLSFANTTANAVNVSAYITRSGVDYYLIKSAPTTTGGTLVVVGADQKIIMQAGDALKVITDTAAAADVILSYISNLV